MLSIIRLLESSEQEDSDKDEKRKKMLKRIGIASLTSAAALHAARNLYRLKNS